MLSLAATGTAAAEDPEEAFKKACLETQAFLAKAEGLPPTAYGFMKYTVAKQEGMELRVTLDRTKPDQQGRRLMVMGNTIILRAVRLPGSNKADGYSNAKQSIRFGPDLKLYAMSHLQRTAGGMLLYEATGEIRRVADKLELVYQQSSMGQPGKRNKMQFKPAPAQVFATLSYVFAIYCRKAPKGKYMGLRTYSERGADRNLIFVRGANARIVHDEKPVEVTLVKRYPLGRPKRSMTYFIDEEGKILRVGLGKRGDLQLVQHIYSVSSAERAKLKKQAENDKKK